MIIEFYFPLVITVVPILVLAILFVGKVLKCDNCEHRCYVIIGGWQTPVTSYCGNKAASDFVKSLPIFCRHSKAKA